MEYERQEIYSSACTDIFGEGVKLWRKPELPKIEFKNGKKKYKVTDIRYLNEAAVNVFLEILRAACNTPKLKHITFAAKGIDENQLDLITDIVSSVDCECKSGGCWFETAFLVTGSKVTTKENGEKFVTFNLEEEYAEIIYNYAQKHGSPVNYIDLVIALVDESEKRLRNRAKVQNITDIFQEKGINHE